MFSTKPIATHELIQRISQKLHKKYPNQVLCTQYAWWALEAITEQPKSKLLLQKQITLTPEQQDTLECWIKNQVENHIPLQYLLGSVPFVECNILVEPPILIPRQETEEWCADLITDLKKLPNQSFRILDLCTGSGCIAIALAKAFPDAKIYSSDISEHALSLAQKNASYNNVHITFLSSDLFSNIPSDLSFDIIIANPPYISEQEWYQLDPSVKEWEDTNALVAPDDGIGMVKQIITEATAYLNQNPELVKHNIGQLIIEIGHTQGDAVKTLYHEAGFTNVDIKKDLHGNDRIAVGYINNVEQTSRT